MWMPWTACRRMQPRCSLLSWTYACRGAIDGRRGNGWSGSHGGRKRFNWIRHRGQVTGVRSKAMTSPCGKIRISINEEGKEKQGQLQECLDPYQGEGIQHIALGATDIFAMVEALRAAGSTFLDTPDTYDELVDKRLPGHGEDVSRLKQNRTLIDGAPTEHGGKLLQIFTETVIGPIFFEIIQRKGDEGFGEGNFKALFESIELDQMRRGVVQADSAPIAAVRVSSCSNTACDTLCPNRAPISA